LPLGPEAEGVEVSRLWNLTQNAQVIDPDDLEEAVLEELAKPDVDYRTRLLIRDSSRVLRKKFGRDVPESPGTFDTGETRGFLSLRERVRHVTRPDTIRGFLRSLADSLTQDVEVVVGGSSALILQGLLSRGTEDVDLVDEVPAPLRTLRRELSSYKQRYGLILAHFQSHYLPEGWRGRLHSDQDYRRLHVFLVDGLDVYVGKLFSRRDKDRDDLHHLASSFDKELVRRHLRSHGQKLLQDPKLREGAERNWFIVYGEELT
jgi:hypothetical protein